MYVCIRIWLSHTFPQSMASDYKGSFQMYSSKQDSRAVMEESLKVCILYQTLRYRYRMVQHIRKYCRENILPTKVRIVKAMVFPLVMYGRESWTIKKTDCWGIDAFELWCWRRLLRVPWTARRANLSILKEINPECSLEGQILKLRLQYFGHLMRREDCKQPLISKEIYGGARDWDESEIQTNLWLLSRALRSQQGPV